MRLIRQSVRAIAKSGYMVLLGARNLMTGREAAEQKVPGNRR
jgi:hypothetical protein